MKPNWKTIGVVAVSAALLYYPAFKLYRYLTKRKDEGAEDGNEDHSDHHFRKILSPAFSGKHKPNDRHTHNGLDGRKKA